MLGWAEHRYRLYSTLLYAVSALYSEFAHIDVPQGILQDYIIVAKGWSPYFSSYSQKRNTSTKTASPRSQHLCIQIPRA
jgi:hypothetical protein